MSNNIFDGFEDKDPQETAKELRIKKESANKIIKNFSAEDFLGITKEMLENKDLWEPDFNVIIKAVNIGTRLSYKGKGYKLRDAEEDYLIVVDGNRKERIITENSQIRDMLFLKEDLKEIDISEEELKNDEMWSTKFPTNEIGRNEILRGKEKNIAGGFLKYQITDIGDGFATIKNLGNKSYESIALDEVQEHFDLWKGYESDPRLVDNNFGITEKQLNDSTLWNRPASLILSQVVLGARLKYKGTLYKVIKYMENEDLEQFIILKSPNGKLEKIGEFNLQATKQNIKFFMEDVMPNELGEKELENDSLWETNFCVSDVVRNAKFRGNFDKLKGFNGTTDLYKVVDIDEKEVKLMMLEYDQKYKTVNINDLVEHFEIYTGDLKNYSGDLGEMIKAMEDKFSS